MQLFATVQHIPFPGMFEWMLETIIALFAEQVVGVTGATH